MRRRLGVVAAAALACQAAAFAEAALPTECDVAVVGAGWAGVYFAWRMAEEGRQVCVFEATHRIGGRTFSHTFKAGSPAANYTLDVGAYRFSPDMHLPGDIILKVLKLPVACYEPSCPPANKDFPPPFVFNYSAPLVRIVDEEKKPAGYTKALEGLVARIEAKGGKVYLGAAVTDVIPYQGRVSLAFMEKEVVANQVMLNLPRNAMLELSALRAEIDPRVAKVQECVKFDLPSTMFPPEHALSLGRSLTKAYAFYQDAWWYTRLNRTEGQWPENAFLPLNTSQGIPIGIHFNDGPVHCRAGACSGFLEVFYATAFEDFFEHIRHDPEQPLGVLVSKYDPTKKLSKLHAAIMEATAPLWKQRGLPQPTTPPELLAVGVWSRTGKGFTAPTKVYYSTSDSVPGGPDPLEKACGVSGLTEAEYRDSVLRPLRRSSQILVANNDWVAGTTETFMGDWAEESLLQAERGLRLLGLSKPGFLDAAYYEEKIAKFAALPGEIVV